jgi:predicted dehydrogenase
MRIARELGHRVVAFADPEPTAREVMAEIAAEPEARSFEDGEALLAEERLADVALIATQDAQHFEHASAALRQGYDVLLEKPAATTAAEVETLDTLARENGRKLILCFVLRYTPFYRAVKKALDDGRIGEVVSINASEGVGPFHHAHSYVRGHWAHTSRSSPMIVAKSSHDTDIIHWLFGSRAVEVSSYAECSHFRPDHAPAGATARCTDGCPHVGSCRYDAHRYLGDQRRWLRNVRADGETIDDDAIREWLARTDWGKCVYTAGQDTPDHQVVSMKFANGATAHLTMTAFDTGRRIRIHGTEGILEGALVADGREPWIECRSHDGEIVSVPLEEQALEGYASHGGGDFGLINALPELLEGDGGDYIESHRIAFQAAAEAKRHGFPA